MSYPYATGKIRVFEKMLFNQTDMERMLNSPNAEEAFKVLYDTNLRDNLLNKNPQDFQEALNDDLKQEKDLIEKICPDRNLFKIIFLKYDFYNIKLLFKAKIKNFQNYQKFISPLGVWESKLLEDYIIKENSKVPLEKETKNIIDNLKKILKKGTLSYEIDQRVDKEYFVFLTSLLKKIKSPFIRNYYLRKIDFINFKSFLRIKKIKRNFESLDLFFIPGGKINFPDFQKIFLRNENEIINNFKKLLEIEEEKIFNEYFLGKNFWQLEKALDNWSLHYVKKSKFISFGPEVIFSYVIAKENAFKNIRIIMVSKLNGIECLKIKKYLRELW